MKRLVKRALLILLICVLFFLAISRFRSGEEVWRGYVSLFLGLGNLIFCVIEWRKL